MALNYKRLALVLGFILVTVGIGFAIYFVFFRNVFGPTNANQNVNAGRLPLVNANRNLNVNAANVNGALPNVNAVAGPKTIADGGPTQVVPIAPTVPGGATVASNGRDLIYYDPQTGLFYQISPDGKTRTLLSPDAYPAVEKVTWSPLRDKAVLEFPDSSKFLYDFRHKQQYTLAPEMENISFSPGADRLTFKFLGEGIDDQLLMVSNFDGSGARTVERMLDKQDQFIPDWSPAGNVIGNFYESIDATRQQVIPIGQLGENFRAFTVPGRGFQGEWSPTGDKLLYSVFTKESLYNPTLYLADGRVESFGDGNISLDLQTWPSKCSFGPSGGSLFCAVPQYLEQASGLFPDLSSSVPDDFYRINLTTGQKQKIATPVDANGNDTFAASQLFLSSDESLLYFYDSRSNQIQKIQLR